MKSSWVAACRRLLVVIVGVMSLYTIANGQVGVDGRTDCTELAPPNAALPDDSLVDAMVADGTVPGSTAYPPLCVGKKLIWREADPGSLDADHGSNTVRRVFYYRPQYSGALILPLIIWSHPNGSSEVLSPTEVEKIAQPAIEHGYAFMSLQFRHPTASQA